MKIVKPDYYDKFKCIADKCPYTCCQEWDIGVDDKTIQKWKCMNKPECANEKLITEVTEYNNGTKLKFNDKGMCPYLEDNGLCKIVIKYGEDCIPETCHVFPREKHEYEGRIEYFLSPGCPAVIDLIWNSNEIILDRVSEIGDEEENDTYFLIRDWFLEIISDKDKPVNILLKTIFFIAMDLYEKERGRTLTKSFVDDYKKEVDIYEVIEAIEKLKVDKKEQFAERNELLLDILDVYRKEGKYSDFINPIVAKAEEYSENDYRDFKIEKNNSEEEFLRKLVCEEIASSLISEEISGIEGMMVKLEWLIMEYVAICQCIYISCDNGHTMSYDHMKYIVTIIFRIMGFVDEDICEVIEGEFDSMVWPWDYVGFIL